MQFRIEAKIQVFSRHWKGVERTVEIAAFLTVMHVHQHHFQAFLATEFFLVKLLDARLPDIVAHLVVWIGGHFIVVHLSDIA